ncbi:MAG: hypothetical protein K0S76_2422 [Herbinix sp.]|jgi:hypothetical protein|nr:hypothetical protein [Herbinix sp.]
MDILKDESNTGDVEYYRMFKIEVASIDEFIQYIMKHESS